MSNVYIGIDPGKSGAIALINEDRDVIESFPKMPWENGRLDAVTLYDFLKQCDKACDRCIVVCEKVHSMPRDSSKSAFTFGGAFHAALACIDLFDFPLLLPSPQTWKKVMLKDRGREKQDSVAAARDMFPALRPKLKAKSSHNLAEAALIAAYGIHSWNNEDGH
jgi:predicted RNase H-like nuclease (RuvC/YqgF family)